MHDRSSDEKVSWACVITLVRHISGQNGSYTITEADLLRIGATAKHPELPPDVLKNMFKVADKTQSGVLTLLDVDAALNEKTRGAGAGTRRAWQLLAESFWLGDHNAMYMSGERDNNEYATVVSALKEHYSGDQSNTPLPESIRQLLALNGRGDTVSLQVPKHGKFTIADLSQPTKSPYTPRPATGASSKSPRLTNSQLARPVSARCNTSMVSLPPPEYMKDVSPRSSRFCPVPKPFGFKDGEKAARQEAAMIEKQLQQMLRVQANDLDALREQMKTLQKEHKQAEQSQRYFAAQLQSEVDRLTKELKASVAKNHKLQENVARLESALELSDSARLKYYCQAEQSAKELATKEKEAEEHERLIRTLQAANKEEGQGWEEHRLQTAKSLEEKESAVVQLTAQVKRLKESKEALRKEYEQKVVDAGSSSHQLEKLNGELRHLAESAIHAIGGNNKERKQRALVSHVLNTPPDREMVLSWVNALVAEYTPAQPPIEDFGGGVANILSYLAFFHVLSPKLLPADKCTKAMQGTLREQRSCVQQVLQSLNIPGFITEEQMFQEDSVPQHIMMLSYLFQRFCDPSLGLAHGFPPLAGTFVRQDSHASTADLKKLLVLAQQEQQTWRKAGDLCFWESIRWSLQGAMGAVPQDVRQEVAHAMVLMGEAREEAKDWVGACQKYRAANVLCPTVPGLIRAANLKLHRLSEPAEAVQLSTQAIALDSGCSQAYRLRGDAHLKLKDHAAAKEDFEHLLSDNKDNWELLQLRGECLLGLGAAEKALSDFQRALGGVPGDSRLQRAVRNAQKIARQKQLETNW